MEREDSFIAWTLYDQNGFEAGVGKKTGYQSKDLSDVIVSQHRPPSDSMGYEVSLTVFNSLVLDQTQTKLEIQKSVCAPNPLSNDVCKPKMVTETRTEDKTFFVDVCAQCKWTDQGPPIAEDDLWCDDLNKALWKKKNAGWEREWECGWKAWRDETTKITLPFPTYPSNNAPSDPGMAGSKWSVKLHQWMERDDSSLEWWVYEPNGNIVGNHKVHGYKANELADTIYDANHFDGVEGKLPALHDKIQIQVTDPGNVDRTRTKFTLEREPCGNSCYPWWQTETFAENERFKVYACDDKCRNNDKTPPISKEELWCDDMNQAMWTKINAGWERRWSCGWTHW